MPVRFIRLASTKALPVPERGGSIRLLRPFCNLRRPKGKGKEGTAVDTDFVVLIGHILAIFRPDASYQSLSHWANTEAANPRWRSLSFG